MKKVGIIGLGLIGGSIYKDLKALGYDVVSSRDYTELKDRDIIFVCTPMNKTLTVLDELEGVLTPETVVADVSSLKEFVCQKQRPYCFVPTHPMAGTEKKGFDNSVEGLFKGAKWVVLKDNPEIIEIIKALGATPVFTTAKAHDEAVAMISHMPMVIAQALFLAASDNPLELELASSGFRDMTRLALSNEEMAMDMVKMNSDNIQHAILKLYSAVGALMTNDYPELIAEIKSKREKMFN